MANNNLSVSVLLIDDDEDAYLLVKRRLASAKSITFNVDWVSSYRLAIPVINEKIYDIYLIDQTLGDGQGLDLLKLLSQRKYRGSAKIMLTNFDSEELEEQAYEAGITEFITKDQAQASFISVALRNAFEREQQRKALEDSEERYALASQGSNDGLWDWDINKGTLYVSQRWRELTGYGGEQSDDLMDDWKKFIHPKDLKEMLRALKRHLKNDIKHYQHQFRYLRKDGSYFWVLIRGVASRDEDGNCHRMAGSLTDIHQIKVTENKLKHQLLHDSLTDLPNRSLFSDRVSRLLEASKRSPDRLFAVLFLDLNRFKVINDSLGHQFGDLLLQVVAKKLSDNLRGEDSIARLYGDEFTILCPLVDGLASLDKLVGRIQSSLTTDIVIDGHKISVSASIGATIGPGNYGSADDMIRDADIAMYQAKRTGCFTLFDDQLIEQNPPSKKKLKLPTD